MNHDSCYELAESPNQIFIFSTTYFKTSYRAAHELLNFFFLEQGAPQTL